MSFILNRLFKLVNNFLFSKKFFYLFFIPFAFYFFSLILYINSFNMKLLYSDISAYYDLPIYAGIFTTLGIFLWVSVFAICIFTRNILLRNKNKNKLKLAFYKYACFLNFILLIDDQFLLHEKFVILNEQYGEIYLYFFYLVIVILMLSKFKKVVVKKEIFYLVISLVFFLGSIAIDLSISRLFQAVLGKFIFNNTYILEDIFKFIGIYYWLIFFGTLSSRIISEEIKFRSN